MRPIGQGEESSARGIARRRAFPAPVLAELRGLRRAISLPSDRVVFWSVVAVVLVLIFPPLISMLYTSFTPQERLIGLSPLTLENYVTVARVFLEGGPFLNSLAYAGGTAVLSVILGGLLAWLVERTDAPLRWIGYYICFGVLAMPPLVYAVAWILLFAKGGPLNGLLALLGLGQAPLNIFTLPGMIFVESLTWVPLAFLLLASSLRMMDPSLEEAAATSGANLWLSARRVLVPLVAPSIAATILLVFIRSIEALAAPALIGLPGKVRVLTTEIYLATQSQPPDYGMASAYGNTLIVLVAGFLYLYALLTRRGYQFQTVTGKGYRARLTHLGRGRILGTAVLLMYLWILVVLPFGILLWGSLQPFYTPPSVEGLLRLTLRHYMAVLNYDKLTSASLNSVGVGAVSAVAVVGLTGLAAWFLIRTRIRFRGLLDLLASFPLVLPAVVLGVAVLRLYANVPLPIYGTLAILVIAYVPRFLPYGMRYCHAGLLQVHRDLEEAAAISGASQLTVFRRVLLPLLSPTIVAGFAFVFLLAVKEFAASVLLVGPRTPVISVALFDLWRDGQITEMAAFSIMLLLVFGSMTVLLYAIARRYRVEAA